MDAADLIREAFLMVKDKKVPERYAHVVADEVQDFSESELHLLRALLPEGPNDLFLVGDAHQRIYGHKASLSRCGINVRGLRSRRLRLNYRTTQSIRNWGVALLRDMHVDDLDEGTDDALKGYHSLRSGAPPTVVHHASEKAEAAFIIAQAQAWLAAGRPAATLCIAARTNDLVEERYAPLLRDAGIPSRSSRPTKPNKGRGSGAPRSTASRASNSRASSSPPFRRARCLTIEATMRTKPLKRTTLIPNGACFSWRRRARATNWS